MNWPALLRRPAGFAGGAAAEQWFARIADALLNRAHLIANGVPHRLVEVEAYYHGPGHEDPFAHRDPIQVHPGRWYFHRTRGVYRGGSFKGLDLSFGGPAGISSVAHAGFLFRGLEAPDGTRIDGPSLLVDRLLRQTGFDSVAALDAAVGGRVAWDRTSPLVVAEAEAPVSRPILRTARVGLSLKSRRPRLHDPALAFVLRRYRYLTDSRRTAKGKLHIVLALHADGVPAEEIVTRTGCPLASVRRYIAAFEAGAKETDAGSYYGRAWSSADLCRLHGLLWRKAITAPGFPGPDKSSRLGNR